MKICSFSLYSWTVNEGSLCSGLLVGQKRQPEDVTLGFRRHIFDILSTKQLIKLEHNPKLQLYSIQFMLED